MLNEAMVIREVRESNDDEQPRYELYDSDTGLSLGTFASYEAAETERQNMKASDRAASGSDADKQDR